MSVTTDFLQLNKTAMFAKIRDGLPFEKYHTQNLLECKDDLLFAWNAKDSNLLVLNWRLCYDCRGQKPPCQEKQISITEKNVTNNNNTEYQILIPSTHITFDVEYVVCSHEGSLIALAGQHGVCILELPQRWGSNGLFMQGKTRTICCSYNLDAQLFGNNPHLHLRQLRWHDASPTDSHLLVLLSNNTIRVYDNCKLRHVWQVGPLLLRSDTNLNSSIVYALGEAVVDFDIAPAVCNTTTTFDCKELTLSAGTTLNSRSQTSIRSNTAKIEWPLVILRENGNIYILMAGLDTERPRLQGPLTITPSQTDNYGLDSCSLLVIPSIPPTLVIAETNGKLHHALLLEAENVENSFNEVDENLTIYPSEWNLHVLETVELELGLPNENKSTNISFCPIHLKRDFINELRYFAYHNTGLHVITINFIAELQRFLESSVNSDIATLTNISSQAEYILCTKIDSNTNTNSTTANGNENVNDCPDKHINAVLGFIQMQMPSSIGLLLSSGQVISLQLVIDLKPLNESHFCKTDSTINGQSELQQQQYNLEQIQLNQVLNSNFVDLIKQLLKRDITQPLLSLDKNGKVPTTRECYELLIQAIEVFRTQYIKKHEIVHKEFLKRVSTIKLWVEQQQQDVEDLENARHLISDKAHKLADKFEELSDQQEIITKRCQDLMRQAQTRLPNATKCQNEFNKEVERLNETIKKMQANLQKLKDTFKKQNYHIMKYQQSDQKKQYELPEVQERTIKEILLQINADIDGQIKEIKGINKIIMS